MTEKFEKLAQTITEHLARAPALSDKKRLDEAEWLLIEARNLLRRAR